MGRDSQGKYVKNCIKCGCSFKTFNESAEYCDKHRRFEIKAESSVKNVSCITQTKEERLERNKERLRLLRLSKGIKPITQVRKRVKVKKRKVTSAVILPVISVRVEVPELKPEAKIWLQVDKRTRIGFVDNAQMERWKEKHKFNQ